MELGVALLGVFEGAQCFGAPAACEVGANGGAVEIFVVVIQCQGARADVKNRLPLLPAFARVYLQLER
jgi:hypothetical protein